MKKSHYKSHYGTFMDLEEKTLEDYRTRRPLEADEQAVADVLRNFKLGEDELTDEQKVILADCEILDLEVEEFVARREEIIAEANRLEGYLRPGKKYPLLARNPQRVREGRRYAYIGTDGQIHIHRKGNLLKVPMMEA